MAAKLPKTQARLSTSAKFFVTLSDVSNTTNIDLSSLTALGAVERFTEANPRATNERYEINSDNPGEIVERIPELVKRSLTIQKAVLYTQDLLNMFGSTDFNDIMDNYKPFTIVKVEVAPEGSNVQSKATIYTGCWFHENPKSYDITSSLKMMQEATIGYTNRFVANVSA